MAIEFSFLQAAENTTDTNVYTFSAQNLGVADANRYIIVAAASRDSGASAQQINSITVGGVSATIVVQRSNIATNANICGLAIAAVPTGTTGDVVVTFSETVLRCAIGLYRAVGISATPTDTDSAITNNPSVNLDIAADGFAIGVSGTGEASAAATWTNLTENYDSQVGTESLTHSGASATFGTQQTGLALTCTWTNNTNPVGCFASWEEAGGAVRGFMTTNKGYW